MATTFNPNKLTFEAGLKRIQQASEKAGIKLERRILTSKDSEVAELTRALKVDNVPEGITKWQLPVHMESATQMFVSIAEPNTKVPLHAHRDGDSLRFIVSGSINFNGQELTAGDWMYVPAGHKYSFEAGRIRVIIICCYACCCA